MTDSDTDLETPGPDFERFERLWQATPAPAPIGGVVRALVIRVGDEAHETPARIEVSPEGAVHGDRWRAAETPHPEAQISLIERRVVDVLVGGDPARWHVPGDNLVVDLDLAASALPVGARLAIGSAVIEVTAKVHAGCHKFRARLGADALRWVNVPAHRPRRLRGLYARIVKSGAIAVGDPIAPAG